MVDNKFKEYTLTQDGISKFKILFQKEISIHEIRKGNFLLLNGDFCKVTKITPASMKNGNCQAINVFNNKNCSMLISVYDKSKIFSYESPFLITKFRK